MLLNKNPYLKKFFGKEVKSYLKSFKEKVVLGLKKSFDFLKIVFSSPQLKTYRKTFMGAFIGILGISNPLFKKDSKEKLKNKKIQNNPLSQQRKSLKTEVQNQINKKPAQATKGKKTVQVKPNIENKEVGTAAEKVAKTALKLTKEGRKAAHCWDFCRQVFVTAGMKSRLIFKTYNKYKGRNCGKLHAKPDFVKKNLSKGDHIFINNQNSYDRYGNHSAIFLEWVDKNNMIAKVANVRGAGKKATISTFNLRENPITLIAKPIAMSERGRRIIHYKKHRTS